MSRDDAMGADGATAAAARGAPESRADDVPPASGAPSLVLDVGTSAVKAAWLDDGGAVLASTEAPLETRSAPGGVSEQDAGAWWRAARGAVRELGAADAGVRSRRLVLTGQMQDLTLADGAGRPLRPTLLYSDVRAVAEAEEVARTLGAGRLVRLTGNVQDAGSLLAKLLWLRRHEPEALEGAEHLFLGAADALAFRLAGVAACDTTTASTTGLMDLDARAPLGDEAFRALGLDGVRARLPRLVPGGMRVGTLRADVADAWGLPAERALARPPARLLYLPYLQGERSPFRDPRASGAFVGLRPDTTRDDLVRAVLEGVALAYRHVLEALVPGDPPAELVLAGGGTRSEGWCRLFATVVGVPVRVPHAPEAGGLRGALRCVQVVDGEAPDHAVPVHGRRFEPDEGLRGDYDRLFGTFRTVHEALGDVYRALDPGAAAPD